MSHATPAGGLRRRAPAWGGDRDDGPHAGRGGLVGRDHEAAELSLLLSRPGVVTVTGPAGVGKSRLAWEVASAADAGFDAGPLLVDLSALDRPGGVVAAVAAGLGVAGSGTDQLPALLDRLGGRRLLIVLDPCEHVLAGCAELAGHLAAAGSGATLVATSREPLGVPGERVLRLAPLPVPPAGETSPEVVGDFGSVQLFLSRCDSSGGGAGPGGDDAVLVARICRAVDGIPRYLEHAAAAGRAMSLGQLAEAVDGGPVPRGSTGLGTGFPGPAADFERSWRMLSSSEARLLRRLSVFSGDWSLDAVPQVCGGDGLEVEEVAAGHAALVAKSLVAELPGSPCRYSMLATTRRLAATVPGDEGGCEGTNRRHAEWCLSLVEGGPGALVVSADEAWLRRLDPEIDNFRAALAWAQRTDEVDLGTRLASELAKCWGFRWRLEEAREWLDWALAQDPGRVSHVVRATVVRRAAVIHGRLGDTGRAQELAEQATTLFREIGDGEEAMAACAFISLSQSPRSLLPGLDESVALARAGRDVTALGYLLSTRAQAAFFLGRLDTARHDFDECVALGRRERHGDVLLLGLLGLGRVDLATGELPKAALELGDAVALAQRTGDDPGRDLALDLSGELARLSGDYGRARALLEEAAASSEVVGESVAIARNLLFRARRDLATGAVTEARAAFLESLAGGRGAKAPPYHETRCLLGLATCALVTGEVTRAEELAVQAKSLAAANDDRLAMGDCLRLLARCGRAAGRSCGAGIRMCQEALRLYDGAGSLPGVIAALEDVAALFVDRNWYDLAARLLAAAEAFRETAGLVRDPVDGTDHARTEATVAEALGDWERARIEGRTLSPSEAVAAACENRGRRDRGSEGWASLTQAEREVVRLVAGGLTSADAATRLYVSRRTVETHLAHVYAKLGIHNRKGLLAWADDAGWAGADPGS